MNRISRGSLTLVIASVLVMGSLFATALWTNAWEWVTDEWRRYSTARRVANDQAPPPTLPIRSEDYRRYPRSDFGFVLETDWGDRVDTFRGLVAKDLGSLPDTTVQLVLSEAELDTIYQKMIEIRFFEYPEPHPPAEIGGFISPSTQMRLTVRAGGAEKTLSWPTGLIHRRTTPEEWKRLSELVGLILEIVRERPEYRALPPTKGAYM